MGVAETGVRLMVDLDALLTQLRQAEREIERVTANPYIAHIFIDMETRTVIDDIRRVSAAAKRELADQTVRVDVDGGAVAADIRSVATTIDRVLPDDVAVRIAVDDAGTVADASRTADAIDKALPDDVAVRIAVDDAGAVADASRISQSIQAAMPDTIDIDIGGGDGGLGTLGGKIGGILDDVNGLRDALSAALPVAGVVTALQAVYETGRAGATVNDTTRSFFRLNEQLGSSPVLLEQLRGAARGTVDDLTLMSATNTLLIGAQGEFGKQLADATPKLLAIASAANRINPALGSVAQLYGDIAVGVKRGSVEILDNLGITVQLGAAYAAYAVQLGKTADQLTDTEKQHAVLNAVLEKGDVLLRQAGDAADASASGYERLGAAASNVWNAISGAVDVGLQGLFRAADALDENDIDKTFGKGTYRAYIDAAIDATVRTRQLNESLADSDASILRNAAITGTWSDEALGIADVYGILTQEQFAYQRTLNQATQSNLDYGQSYHELAFSQRVAMEQAQKNAIIIARANEIIPEVVSGDTAETLALIEATANRIAGIRPDLIGSDQIATIANARAELEHLAGQAENLRNIRIQFTAQITNTVSEFFEQNPEIKITPKFQLAAGEFAADLNQKIDEYIAQQLLARTTTAQQNIAVRLGLDLISPEQADLELKLAGLTDNIDIFLTQSPILIDGVPVDLGQVLLREGPGVVAGITEQLKLLADVGLNVEANGTIRLVQTLIEGGQVAPEQYDNVVRSALTQVAAGKTVEQAVAIAIKPEYANIESLNTDLQAAIGDENIQKIVEIQTKLDGYDTFVQQLGALRISTNDVPDAVITSAKLDTSKFDISLTNINQKLDTLQARTTMTKTTVDDTAARQTLDQTNTALDAYAARTTATMLTADASAADQTLDELEIRNLSGKTVTVTADVSAAEREIARVTASRSMNINVGANGGTPRARGGVDVLRNEQLFLAGEAGDEIASFVPLDAGRALASRRVAETLAAFGSAGLLPAMQSVSVPPPVVVHVAAQRVPVSSNTQTNVFYTHDNLTTAQIAAQLSRYGGRVGFR